MEQLINAKIDDTLQELLKTIELAVKYGDEDAKNLNMYGQLAEDLLITKHKARICEEALEVARKEETVASFDKVYTDYVNSNTANDPKQMIEFKNFISKAQSIIRSQVYPERCSTRNRLESDGLVMECQISDIDPLTKRRMVDPVKNIICGHYYEKSSIFEALKVNSRLRFSKELNWYFIPLTANYFYINRCPVTACGNNQFITQDNLVEDEDFKMKLQTLAANNRDDDDDL